MTIFHADAHAMARVLIQYIPCDKRVQTEVYVNLERRLELETIADLRAADIKRRNKHNGEMDCSVVWMDERHGNDMAAASMNLLQAIEAAKVAA